MKSVRSAFVATALTAVTVWPLAGMGTVWADAHTVHSAHAYSAHSTKKHETITTTWQHRSEAARDKHSTAMSATGKHKTTAPSRDTAAHAAKVQQLHAAIEQLHRDTRAAQQARRQLEQAAHTFANTLQQATQAGDVQAVDQALTGAKSVMEKLRSALKAQSDSDTASHKVETLQKKGDLAQALAAIHRADQRQQQKAALLTEAAQQLAALTQTLQQELAALPTSSSGGTTVSGNTDDQGQNEQVSVTVHDRTSHDGSADEDDNSQSDDGQGFANHIGNDD
jgi:small-conductance mechanosensitive channel